MMVGWGLCGICGTLCNVIRAVYGKADGGGQREGWGVLKENKGK